MIPKETDETERYHTRLNHTRLTSHVKPEDSSRVRSYSVALRHADEETSLSSPWSLDTLPPKEKLREKQREWHEELQWHIATTPSPRKRQLWWHVLLNYALIAVLLVILIYMIRHLAWSQTARHSPASHHSWEAIDTLYVFGDSYTDTGNGVHMSEPSKTNPFNESVHQFPRSPRWINYLTQFYLPTRFKGGVYNYAVGGATVDQVFVAPYLRKTSFVQQTTSAIKAFGGSMRHESDRAAVIVWFGVNDIYLWYLKRNDSIGSITRGTLTPPPLAGIFKTYQSNIERLYDAGLRNFLFLTMPTVNRATSVEMEKDLSGMSNQTEAEVYRHREAVVRDIEAYNARILGMRSKLKARHADIETRIFDAHSWHARVLETPLEFETMHTVRSVESICEPLEGTLQDFEWFHQKCKEGSYVREHAWVPLHMTPPLHNATGWRVSQDCFGSVPTGFCV